MVKYLLVNVFMFFTFLFIAQTDNKDVVITSSGIGTTQEQAKQTALRNAIEQAFGAFISSKTEIFNDEIVADQMSSVSSGNVKSYEVLNESQLPNGTWASTLRVIVSVDKLTSFVEAKGITVEIKGGLFALNIKQQLLNEQGEINAIEEMFSVLHEVMQTAFDYSIKSGDPKSLDVESKNWEIPLTVTATANKNMDFCANYCIKTLESISLSFKEVQSYRGLNKAVFPIEINYNGVVTIFYLRKQFSLNILNTLVRNWEFYTRLFTVKSGIDKFNGLGVGDFHKFTRNQFEHYDYNKVSILINFLSSGQQAATFSYQDRRTLSQIEQISGFIVSARGAISQIKHGGFVVYEFNGHGLVASICDFDTRMDWWNDPGMLWFDANKTCEEFESYGFFDWRLPSKKDLEQIYWGMFKVDKIGNLKPDKYWSSSSEVSDEMWFFDFKTGYPSLYLYKKRYVCRVRAVRNF